jgi:hypothetical protein
VRNSVAILAVVALILTEAAVGDVGRTDASLQGRVLAREPYNYSSRAALVTEYTKLGDHNSAYYHAAWLAWLAPREYADSDQGIAFLWSREVRDRAAGAGGAASVAIKAVEAHELLHESCLSGTVEQQHMRLRGEIGDHLTRAEQMELKGGRHDPVIRIALARLTLALDDAVAFDSSADHRRMRLSILRKAASRASSVAGWLPDCPGPHRLLARIRARMADIENGRALWALAISDAERAHSLDPGDTALVELLWVLNLRAGNWQAARRWQTRLEAASGGCSAE